MARFVAAKNSEVAVENINLEQIQKADEIWNRTVDRIIESEGASLRTLQKHMQEMDATLDMLETLPNKVSHAVMVPFGSVAMFPGELLHTNEVHMKLSPAVSVCTSSKHAAEILGRRKAWLQEKQALVEEQIHAMNARKDFAEQQKNDYDGEEIREIVEPYDEALHGSLDTPAVRDEVHSQRQYYGPPRSAEELAAHNSAMQRVQAVAIQVQAPAEHTQSEEERPLAGCIVHQEGGNGMDSDDEDEDTDPTHASLLLSGSTSHGESGHTMALSANALDEEVDRLMMALQSTCIDGTSLPATSTAAPLVEELHNSATLTQDMGNVSLGDESSDASLQPQDPTANTARSTPASSCSTSTNVTASGLKAGFFSSSTKVKRRILKKTEAPGRGNRLGSALNACDNTPHHPTHDLRAATEQFTSSATMQAAFNGTVCERETTTKVTQDTQATSEPQGPIRVSKFKARMAAQRQQQSS